MNTLSLQIIDEIKRLQPADISLIDFFMEMLSLKREAAYRRLRGEIPLSLDELQVIVSTLNISVDKLAGQKTEGVYSSSIVRMNEGNLVESYFKTMEQIVLSLHYVKQDPQARLYGALSLLPAPYLLKYPMLSKFRLYKWTYQCRKSKDQPKMSATVFPKKIRDIEIEYMENNMQIATHYIWIKELFGPFICDVRYFFELGLVTKDEVNRLKEESLLMLETMTQDINRGETNYGAPLFVYLANTYLDSNYIYMEGNRFKASSFNVFGINYLSSVEEEICNDTRDWIESLMRFSTLISGSGEMEKNDFFKLQKKMIDTFCLNNLYEIYESRNR